MDKATCKAMVDVERHSVVIMRKVFEAVEEKKWVNAEDGNQEVQASLRTLDGTAYSEGAASSSTDQVITVRRLKKKKKKFFGANTYLNSTTGACVESRFGVSRLTEMIL